MKRLYKILNSWVGALIFIALGILIVYFLLHSTEVFLYVLILVGVPLIYYFKKQDWLPYILGGIIAAFLAHFFLGLVLSTSLPVVAVMTPSMQHDNVEITHYQWLEKNLGYNRTYINSWPLKNGFSIGDMLVIVGSDQYQVGDVIVYSVPTESLPIIHRIVKVNGDGTYQTKGDNNPSQLPYELSIGKEQIKGKAIFLVPKLGYFKVIFARIFGVY